MTHRRRLRTLLNPLVCGALAAVAWLPGAAWALKVSQVSPQGEVAKVRQVVVDFDGAAVRFGDAQAGAPFALACSDAQAARGQGRWLSERRWTFDLAQDLPPGVRCTLSPEPGFAPLGGAPWRGAQQYRFNTGGPALQDARPHRWRPVDEEQFFILQLNADATRESVQQHAWCELDGVGERVPVRLIDGAQRQTLLQEQHLDKKAAGHPLRWLTLACARRMTAGTDMQLVLGAGLATPSGVATTTEQRLRYEVRAPFAAEFSCERENAQSACLPIRPLRLSFNAPVERKRVQAIHLKGGGLTLAPQLDDEGKGSDLLDGAVFSAPLPPSTAFTLELPKDFRDAAGRPLANAESFPLQVTTAALPPLAKFAAAPFGVIERYAEGPDGPALLPVTLRKVESQLPAAQLQPGAQPAGRGQVAALAPDGDAQIIAWMRKLERYDAGWVERKQAQADGIGLPPVPPPDPAGEGAATTRPQERTDRDAVLVQARSLSLLAGQTGVQRTSLPPATAGDPRPFEVVGIALKAGYHVVEIASPLLGGALLDPRYGEDRTMYVRTSALVTNLGVHFKLGREGSLAWVTTLDGGEPVAGARVQVSSCAGDLLASAATDGSGIARLPDLDVEPPTCKGDGGWRQAYFVSARSGDDLAFVWSDSQRGIEPWRFNVPTSDAAQPDVLAHTVLDRTLVRAGETVSMKHLLRSETAQGFALPAERPATLRIVHVGSGREFTQPLHWRQTPTGGLSASSEFHVPPAAKLGEYQLRLGGEDAWSGLDAGSFRVEEFRLPVLQGSIAVTGSGDLVRPRHLPVAVQVGYVAGGPARQLPVRVSAMVRAKPLAFEDFDAFSFDAPRASNESSGSSGEEGGDGTAQDTRVVADKLALTLDAQGQGQVTIDDLPRSRAPQDLVLEARYADPNGEVQTLSSTRTLWPAAVVAGIKTEGWASAVGSKLRFQALALGTDGRARAGVPLSVQAYARTTYSSRKRLVGGFYSYDNRTETHDLGTVCTGKSDERGLLLCETALEQSGEVELVATARDKEGNEASAAASVWITRRGELWFGGQDHDRIDLLPEKKSYEPGETARLQLRMPYRQATALVTVEREGILSSRVVQLDGRDPTLQVEIEPGWAPNVYVSALVLRGRLREVPWYSFFTWGYKMPRAWWSAFWQGGREYTPPTALVDLSKPSYRLGMAELKVGAAAHRIDVKVSADQASYPVRGKAQVTIAARLPDGRPAAGAEVAVAAVDQALLELMPNRSWNLLDAMLARRSWGVQTATAQMDIIGRRHYGKKAVPAGGGGGGGAPTRELLDTLLLWQPAVKLDEKGEARITVPLNDALTTFQIVAVADAGVGLFGTGQTAVRSTQDLQIISGLPPLVRTGDRFSARVTLRNTTDRAMRVQVAPRATLLTLAPQTVDLPAQQARELGWDVTVPGALADTRASELLWEIEAHDTLAGDPQGKAGARDALKVSQRVEPAVPVTVQQATLAQLAVPLVLDVAPPPGALPGRGGLALALQPRLAEGLPGVRDWWARYPFSCLEQQTSRAIGLGDAQLWQGVAAQLPAYLDGDGLASYFPPRDGESHRGSDTLSAYLLAATDEAAQLDARFALPEDARQALLGGLAAFVEGRIERRLWSPLAARGIDLDVRKLAAIEALSRYGRANARMLSSITIAPNQWPTHAVLDWLNIVQRMPELPRRAEQLGEAQQILRSRLNWQGTRLDFSTERSDAWWWLMQGSDVNAARLLLAVIDDPAWQGDLGRLVTGFIARQQGGAWHTTTANFWGALALRRFSAAFESTPVAGQTRAVLGSEQVDVDWAKVRRIEAGDPQGAAHRQSAFGAPAAPGMLEGNTAFVPWPAQGGGELLVEHRGGGAPWLTLQSLAAVPLTQARSAGFAVRRSVTLVEQANPALSAGQYSRGDVLRVTLEVDSQADMTWVVVTDPVPAGATILGSGLGRDSEIATQGEKREGRGWSAFEERSFSAYRSYYEYLPKGKVTLQYTLRLNNAGQFQLPPTRVEALYAPEMFGEAPNAGVTVVPQGVDGK